LPVKIKKNGSGTPSQFKTIYLYDYQYYREMESRKANVTRLMLFMLGMTAMSVQVIMIRESMALFHGNELIIGLFLGIWMMLTAAGAYIASWPFHVPCSMFRVPFLKSTIENDSSKPPCLPASALILLSLLPITTLSSLIFLRYTLVPFGIMPGPGLTILIIFIALLPFCLVSGMLFPILVQSLSALKGKILLSEGYALESAGSIVGGILFSLVFIFILTSFESLLILALSGLCLLVTWYLYLKRIAPVIYIVIIGIIFVALYKAVKPEQLVNYLQFRKMTVLAVKNSPYGKLTATSLGDNVFIYENGVPVTTGDDDVYREESVHYAMLLHQSPSKVLLISGGTSGMIEEVLKYPVDKVDYVEENPWLIRFAMKYRPLPDDRRVGYVFADPRIFFTENDDKYDVILINTPDPNSAAQNRFYTTEFYNLLKSRLNAGGILSMSVPAAGNYMSGTSGQIHSVAYNTLKTVFSQVRVIPGAKDYFLASDSTIEQSIFRDFQRKGIRNNYVNPYYINEELLKMRSDLIMKDILTDTQRNSDLKPFVFSLLLKQWLERYKINSWLIPLILMLLLVLSLIFLGPLNLGLFTGGFTASGLEFILLIWLQVIYGYVYQVIGLFFAIFMAGLVIGSWVVGSGIKEYSFKGFIWIQGLLACLSLLIAGLMLIIRSGSPNLLIISLIFILLAITGLLVGIQFAISAQLRKEEIQISAGESFSADLLGSAIGVILVSVYLVPQFGLPVTGLLLAGLNVLALVVMAVRGRRSEVSGRW
jgi:spermidine synthase